MKVSLKTLRRRDFLGSVAAGAAAVLSRPASQVWAAQGKRLLAGEGVVDITPPLGIELGGFHRRPGNERRVKGIRQPCAVRALVLQLGDKQVAICSLDVAAVGQEMAARIQSQVAADASIPRQDVRVCATHTHSMPAFCFLRQWGSLPKEFMAQVEAKTVQAVRLAKADLAPAEVSLGKARAVGGNHNRTTKDYKKDDQFTKDSTDQQRWLDTMLHVLLFERPGGKRTLAWYHFSAHPVCFADDLAGPDWPGMVAELAQKNEKLSLSFLQGHCGDVNPGDGKNWRGDATQTVSAIYPALRQALSKVARIKVDRLSSQTEQFSVPLDVELWKSWLAEYQSAPSKCTSGHWVDAGFAEAWFQDNSRRNFSDRGLPIPLSAMQLGELAMVFHPAELYSYYGLAIRRDSPLSDTLVVGYADGIIGYLADPRAYEAREYAAITVPKILDVGPFTPTAAREVTAAALALLRRTVA